MLTAKLSFTVVLWHDWLLLQSTVGLDSVRGGLWFCVDVIVLLFHENIDVLLHDFSFGPGDRLPDDLRCLSLMIHLTYYV